VGSNIEYNLQGKLKKLKKQAQNFFTAGYSPAVVSGMLRLSPELCQAWHDDFVTQVLKGSPTKRLFLREMLLKNAPSMILILVKLATQQGDEKLAYAAANSVLAFGSKFMNEDLKIKAIEDRVIGNDGPDATVARGLFDFVDPDHEANKQMQIQDDKPELSEIEKRYESQIVAALETMEEKERSREEESGDGYQGVGGPSPKEEEGQVLDVFDGLNLDD
jgi:hypothetical protein